MAIQTLLPGYNPGAALGESLGAGLGSGLSGILEGLAANRLQQLQQAQQQNQQAQMVKSLEGLGLSANQAQAISSLQPDLQQLFVKDLLAQPAQQAYAQALGLLEPSQTATQQEAPLQKIMNLKPTVSPMESLQLLQGKIPQTMLQQMQQVQPQIQPQIEQPKPLPRLTEKQATEIAKIRREEAKEQRKLTHEQQKEANKETKAYYDEISKGAKAAKDSNIRLDRMENLVNEGKLQGNVFIKGLDSLEKIPYIGPIAGAVEAALLNPQSQEFKKLSADFVKDAKNFFGNRITQREVELFLNTVPTLSQSSSGKRRIINNMRIFNQAALLRKKAIDEIIDENKGNRPRNLDSLVEKKIDKQLNKLASKFTTGIKETKEQQEQEEYEKAPGRRKIFKDLGIQLPQII